MQMELNIYLPNLTETDFVFLTGMCGKSAVLRPR